MGGEPVAVFLSLALPQDVSQSWVRHFVRSLVSLAEHYGTKLAGGDTAVSRDGILADIIVIGSVPKGGALLRSGARPGDRIFVSGSLGGSAAAVLQMTSDPKKRLQPAQYSRHFFPEPRIELGRILREKGFATAMIDTSDGLSTDLAHICEEIRVGAEIEEASIPLTGIGKPSCSVNLDLALHGGGDCELLFTVSPTKKMPKQIEGIPITQIGHITRRRSILISDGKRNFCKLEPRGWEHFSRRS